MKKKPLFRRILFPLLGLVIIESLILVGAMLGQGLKQELTANEEAMVNGKVGSRKSYLESVMTNNWMNLSDLVERLNTTAKRLLVTDRISLDTLDDGSEMCTPLLNQVSSRLIEMMRANHVTGAYIILNTEDLGTGAQSGTYPDKPGIFLRDLDPVSQPSERNEDLLIVRSPKLVVRDLGIATDADWKLRFEFNEDSGAYYDALYYPFQMAYQNESDYDWRNMGYWSATHQFAEEDKPVLCYSVPLILDDGTVYGVLGIDLTLEYIQTMLPYEELDEAGTGDYFIAQYSEVDETFCNVFGNGTMESLIQTQDGQMRLDTEHYYTYVEPMRIYSNNAPFSEISWVLVGAVPYQTLNHFQNRLWMTMLIAVVVTLLIAFSGCLVISLMQQRPVVRMAQEMKGKDSRRMVQLQPTGILEIDQIAEAVEQLSRDVIESGKTFSRIIEMASVRLAGFQIDRENRSLFLTENFFAIFGRDDIDEQNMTLEEFESRMQEIQQYYLERDESVDGYIYQIQENGKQRFIRVRVLEKDAYCYGLAEDVTQALLEKRILKHERDHDSLTNLYNPRAFRRQLQELFDSEGQIGIGAFLMIDLDNLKYVNDMYGHDCGDRYITKAAAILDSTLSGQVCYARISGDEFNVFIYGYENREEIEAQIRKLRDAMNSEYVELPDGKMQRMHATGGVAWYPDDSCSFQELSKYADYAMYAVKRTNKGEFANFDMTQYQNQDALQRSSAALTGMLDNQMLYYAFQPIVDARTGEIFAYEALMRPDVAELPSVKNVMDTARRDGKLQQIEELTWFLSLETFHRHVQEGRIAPDSYLFINSIPNQCIPQNRIEEFVQKYQNYIPRLVLELTEEERMDGKIWDQKQMKHRVYGGKIALDDYGTGYNSEKTLLSVSPDYIKVDIAIVKEIHLNPDKRTIMEYIINYAHERGKYIIAEGVETREEVETVVALGADYLQGYFFARPQRMPDGISQEGRILLMELRNRANG